MFDSDEEDMIIAAATTTLAACYYQNNISKTPCRTSILSGEYHVIDILNGHPKSRKLPYRETCFLAILLYSRNTILCHSSGVRIEEQLAIFMQVVGHNQRNQLLQERFQHSRETISRHFNNVLNAIVALSGEFFQSVGSKTPPEILQDTRFYLYFKDCVGAIDGTHIPALVSSNEKVPFINRKRVTSQSVLVACSFDLQFQYVLAGWEGSATDSLILNFALTRANKLHVSQGALESADIVHIKDSIDPVRDLEIITA